MFDQPIHDAFAVKDVLAVSGTLDGLAVCIVGETNRARCDYGKWVVDAKVRHHFLSRRLQYHLWIEICVSGFEGVFTEHGGTVGTIPFTVFLLSFLLSQDAIIHACAQKE
jgi:hypothetical protein